MPRRISAERTRKEMIDPQLEQAGWYLRDHSKVKIEIPVDGYDAEPWNGISDYTLYRENGEVLAVVEAKKTAVDVRLAEAQLPHYVTEIEKHQSFRPFGFLANGLEIHFVDVGIAHKREVFGFFTREDLESLLSIRQNAKPLSSIEINSSILDRSYQYEAIRTQLNYNADQIRFLRAVQSVFLQKRHLETADLYEPPLDMFGADAVARWCSKEDISEIVKLNQHLQVLP